MDREKNLRSLGELITERGLQALIVPSEDAHQTEMVANKDKRRAWASGFTGSAGLALIYLDKKSDTGVKGDLWTDSRYFLQAESELDAKYWTLRKMRQPKVPSLTERLIELNAGQKNFKVGIDMRHVTFSTLARWSKMLEAREISFEDAEGLVDQVRQYKESAEVMARQAVFHHALEYAGETVGSKLERVRAFLKDEYKPSGKFALVASDLSEVCWLTNTRGRNIVDFCPLFFGFCILTESALFLTAEIPDGNEEEVKALQVHFKSLDQNVGLKVMPYSDFQEVLKKEANNRDIFLPTSTSQKVYNLCKEHGNKVVVETHSIVSQYKAMKNKVEVQGMRQSSIEDSVAMARYLHWLEQNITSKSNKSYDEVDVADVLAQFRSEGKDFDGLSFDTISSYGSNGAVIHYSPSKDKPNLQKLGVDSLYLVDSGGQYLSGGTTDVTRTVIMGTPTPEMKKYFTLVLEGHIKFANHVITPMTTLSTLDGLARQALKDHKANYGHGTSHGVGSFLNVHELPVGYPSDVIEEGMCFSNEPGFYKDGHWGIRIESVVAAVQVKDSENLRLETLNYIPIQRKLVDLEFLSEASRKWLNNYHKDTYDIIGPLLEKKGYNDVRKWLEEATQPL